MKRKKTSVNIFESWRLYNLAQYYPLKTYIFSISEKWKPFLLGTSEKTDSVKRKTSSKRNTKKSSEYIAYRFYGEPTQDQEDQLKNNTGACRFLWNRMRSDREYLYKEMGIVLNNTPADYKDIPELEWLNEVDSYALLNVQLDLERAYADYLSGERGKPKYKKKGVWVESYTTNKDKRCDNVCLDGNRLKLPKINGTIKIQAHREIKPGGLLKSCTVTHEPNGKWFFSLLYEYPEESHDVSDRINEFIETGDIGVLRHIGLDMSLPHLYVDSDGNTPSYIVNDIVVEFQKSYRKLEKQIAREQRKLSRRKKLSNNYIKQQEKVARLHAKAKHQRRDFIEQLTARLSDNYDVISIEDLNMSAMKQSLRFGKSVSDNGWGIFVNRLADKCEAKGRFLIRVDKWFPSSKKCLHCGHIHKELKLSDRTYICPKCGHEIDRDYQAAQNIDNEGLRIFIEALLEHNVQCKFKAAKAA